MNRQTLRAVVTLVLVLASSASTLQAQLDGFEPIGDYVLKVAGETREAEIFRSQIAGSAILVVSPALSAPVLLRPRERTVERLRAESLFRQQDGSASLLGDPVLAASGSFTVLPDGSGVSFSVDGAETALAENPWQIGLHSRSELLEHSAGYVFLSAKYNPSQSLLRTLRESGEKVTVRVFFGSWCPACQQLIPKILKVDEQLEGSAIQFEYYGLPRPFDGEPEAEKANVHSVPTGVVLRNGREIGRIQGNSWRIPELAIQNTLVDAS